MPQTSNYWSEKNLVQIFIEFQAYLSENRKFIENENDVLDSGA